MVVIARTCKALLLLPSVFAETLRFCSETHVMGMYFLPLLPVAELSSCSRIVFRLRGDTPEGKARITEFRLEYFFVFLIFDAFGSGKNAVPITCISEFDGGITEELLLVIYLFKQLAGFSLSILSILIKLFFVLFQLDKIRRTRMTKLLILRLYF
jgi:hypothetical protein